MAFTLDFSEIRMKRLPEVGGKNASLGEMFNHLADQGIEVPDGFAVTASAYWRFLKHNALEAGLCEALRRLDTRDFSNLAEVGFRVRAWIGAGVWPEDVKEEILAAHARLIARCPAGTTFAVRSSATAEDLPGASFAGQMESYLNVADETALLAACHRCFVSLYTDRAIKYRVDKGFEHMNVAVSVCVQRMVRSDLACSGVGFTLDPDSGNTNVVALTGAYGLGENVVQGAVTPDQFLVFKGARVGGRPALVSKRLGAKEKTLVYGQGKFPTLNLDTPADKRAAFALTDEEALRLAGHCLRIEEYYGQPMDIEWAKDGLDGRLFIVQARPETVHGKERKEAARRVFRLEKRGTVLALGAAVGEGVAAGTVRHLKDPSEAHLLRSGEVLVTETTNPDWDPILRRAAAIVTDKGGRTSHAAIVARELGVVALVGTGNATSRLPEGGEVTVSCAEGPTGYAYAGKLPYSISEIPVGGVQASHVAGMLIASDPGQAFRLARLPSAGVGLLRLEFAINRSIGVHPMALLKWDDLPEGKEKETIREKASGYKDMAAFFVEKLAEAVGTVAAAFYPRPVIVRFSDFKSNEYANLLGGKGFEPVEENPMLGFRGASRYYHPLYREAFRLECGALRRVREDMGLTNVQLMIPFCRTVEEAAKVQAELAENRLRRGEHGLEVYMMTEIPSNVLLMEQFAAYFDGFSIGSNDLTQLTLGIDRDSSLVSPLFQENNPAVRSLIARAIQKAHRCGRKIGLCGQAPSDDADFAAFLAGQGIDSIAFNPDAFPEGMRKLASLNVIS